ncbi:MAG: ExbD/TolR family protein [Proteobacteria bacterium]|nr:ExbD/TolR family protein [Pseudomonadota bacterium]
MAFQTSFDDHEEADHGLMAEINIIPLVDVMLVLLIIFMVAAPLSYSGIDVNLPKTSLKPVSSDTKNEPIVVSISESGEYYLKKKQIPFVQLGKVLLEKFTSERSKDVIIRADKDVVYAKVVGVMNVAKGAGAQKISLIMESEDIHSRNVDTSK